MSLNFWTQGKINNIMLPCTSGVRGWGNEISNFFAPGLGLLLILMAFLIITQLPQ